MNDSRVAYARRLVKCRMVSLRSPPKEVTIPGSMTKAALESKKHLAAGPCMSDHRPMLTLSPDLRRFVVAKIPTVSHLEALLLLRATNAACSVGQLGARLYVSLPQVIKIVDDLETVGLAVHLGENVQYMPKSDKLAQSVDELAQAYARRLVEVTQLIHSANDRKARRFADAFLVRKDS